MQEKKFLIPAIAFAAIGCVCAGLMLPVEAIAVGCIGLLLSVLKRGTHRVKLSLVLSVIALLGGVCVLVWMFYAGSRGIAGFSYWFYRLFYT